MRTSLILTGILFLAIPVLALPAYVVEGDLHKDRVVFRAEDDLWLARLAGDSLTDLRRITSHDGVEGQPRISPDGRQLAFSAEYDGNKDIFVMPIEGGEPRRITWHPFADRLVDWSLDGESLVFRSYRNDPHRSSHLYRISASGGDPELLPLGRANYLAVDPETGLWAFTRTWGGGTWKRYRGGTAPEIWVGNPDREDYHEVTDFDGMDLLPMWHNGRIFFLSDKGGTANLWKMRADGSARQRLTDFGNWDARSPSQAPDGRILFTLAGNLQVFDPASREVLPLPLELPSERILTRRRYPNPSLSIRSAELAPDAERVLVEARGEIFTVPVEEGVTLPVTRGSGARERAMDIHPDGKRVAYVSDEGGEEAILSADAWGRGDLKTLRETGEEGYIYSMDWSPDGKWLAYSDHSHGLYLLPEEGGEPWKIAHGDASEIRSYRWSPDGRWMAYTHTDNFDRGTIFLFDTSDSTTHQVTSNLTYDSNPTWDPEGNYLHFMSNRTVRPTIGSRDFETIIEPGQRPYSLLLREDVENPFLKNDGIPPLEEEESDSTETDLAEAETDSLEVAETDSLGTEAPADSTELAELEKDEDEEKLDPVEIDFDGILSRYIEHEKVPPGRYFGLQASKDKLFFLARPDDEEEDDDESGHGSFGGLNLKSYQIEDEELSTFARGVRGYQLLNEKNKILLVKIMGGLQVVDSMAPPGPGAEMMDVSGLQIELDPREEWHQIYRETWRVMRDFYWDESMQGVDWQAVHDQYAPLLDRIASRSDLNDILAEMIGELSTGHTYVFGGDHPQRARRRGTGLLGATLQREGEAFRVDHIYRGGQLDRRRSPLDVPGVEVDEGDYILEVNLRQVPLDRPFESALDNLAGRDVMLTVADSLGGETRHVIVHTLRSDSRLVYLDWVRQNREAVSEATGGRIGYIHIPDMGMRGLTEFGKWFYPQLDKEGMVVDVRWNGGGFVSQLILERFQRHIISWDRQRRGGVMTYPYRVLNGPFVVLTNEHAGSDGDIFPAAVQLDGLAPVIGKRSWGGVIGIRGFMGLVDGGGFSRPEFAWWDSKRGWSLEGHGVDPDIEVDNRPQDLARGEDPQLDRAIEEVLKLHRKHPPLRPDFGPAPDRSREAYRKRELN